MKAVFAFLCLFTISTVQAQDLYRNDINAMLTAKFTFDGNKDSSRDDSFKLGFTVNHSHIAVNRTGAMNLTGDGSWRQSLLDIEVSSRTRYFSRFKVGGVDALTYRTTLNAFGKPIKWPLGLNTDEIIGIGILAAVGSYYAYDNSN